MVKCGNCKYFDDPFPHLEDEDDTDGKLGTCEWPVELPHAFRYCKREAMGVWSLEESNCEQFEKENEVSEHAIENAKAWLENIVEMVEAFEDAEGLSNSFDDAYQTVQESVLSVQVRDGWYGPGEENAEPEEFEILLTTGGPGLRIYGRLGVHGEPIDIELQYQDWGTPWTRYNGKGGEYTCKSQAALETFTQQFYFGE